MIKKMFIGIAIFLGLAFSMQQKCFAQEITNDELKAEREVLKSEMKSEDAQKRTAKFKKLENPGLTNIVSIDQLADISATLLVSSKNVSAIIPEMYKRTVGETVDGITDLKVEKPELKELLDLSLNIASQVVAVKDATKLIEQASSDLKTISPLKARTALKSLNFSKDVLSLVGPELQLNLKVVNNLIATIKSADNL